MLFGKKKNNRWNVDTDSIEDVLYDEALAEEAEEEAGRGMERRERKKRRSKFLLFIPVVILAVVTALAAFVLGIAMGAPALNVLDAVPKGYRSSVLSDDGEVVLTLKGEESNRVYVRLDEIPEDLQHAFVAIEDMRFYEHHGIDLRGIARAFVKGVKTGNFSEGASTITQQLLKNNVFTEWTGEVTFEDRLRRKIQEQYLALKLERRVSKNWILENYLNTINLGGGNWGVETAARYYFDKDVSDLTLSESAVLAAITRNPTNYNPLKNEEANRERRSLVLTYMRDQGYITENDCIEALADPVYERIRTAANGERTQEIMNYFEDALVYQLIEDFESQLGMTEDEAWDLLYKGGLTIRSTENEELQALCEKAASDDELIAEKAEISMVVLDSRDGSVKALIGGKGEKTASLLLNRATSVTRQPGSTIKVLGEYAAGLESSLITLGTTFDDAPYSYSDGTSIVNSNGSYMGMTTVRTAIVNSNNIVALKTFQMTGMESVWNQLKKFGISTLTDADKVEALALGGTSGGVTNMEMTAAYSTLARGGTYIEPVYYTKVLDREGNVLLENVPETHEAVSSATAALLTDALQDVVVSGTGTSAAFSGMDIAGKSGTTSGVRDAWFIGYSPYYTCGIWGGCDDNSEQESSQYVQLLWKNVMTAAHEDLSETSLTDAAGQTACLICTKSGKLAIPGVCDSTVQGDMTRTEYFEPGTEPTESCDCHVAVEICEESGELKCNYCPSTVTRVYLKEASEGTEDAQYVLPDYLSGHVTCEKHRYFWSGWFHGSGNNDSANGGGSDSPSGSSSGYNNGNDGDDLPSYNDPHGSGDAADEGYSDQDGKENQYGEDQRDENWWDFLFNW